MIEPDNEPRSASGLGGSYAIGFEIPCRGYEPFEECRVARDPEAAATEQA